MNFSEYLNFWEMSLNQFIWPFTCREMRISEKYDFPEKLEFPGILELETEMWLNQFIWPFASQEIRIPWTGIPCDCRVKFKFLGNVTKPVYVAIYFQGKKNCLGNLISRENFNFKEHLIKFLLLDPRGQTLKLYITTVSCWSSCQGSFQHPILEIRGRV